MSKYWSQVVRELEPYVPGEQPQIDGLIKLNTNESPYPPSPKVMEVLTQDAVDRLRLYPDPNSKKLKSTLAAYYQIKPDQVFVGNGSDEVLALVFLAFFQQAKPILFPDITYSFYPAYCKLFGIEYKTIPLKSDFSLDLNDYTFSNGGVIFPNPNAPTSIGTALSAIESFVQSNTDSVVVVDEAYVDFGAETATSLVDKYPNLLIVQTLSKSRSLAGLRVGFAMGHADLINALDRVKNSFNSYPIDRLAEAATINAFEDDAYFQWSREKIMRTRTDTEKALTSLGFSVLPSQANFLFVTHTSRPATEIAQALREKKILVRHFNLPRINNYLRISVGSDEQMQTMIEVLKTIVG